jgi:hypothetical protein
MQATVKRAAILLWELIQFVRSIYAVDQLTTGEQVIKEAPILVSYGIEALLGRGLVQQAPQSRRAWTGIAQELETAPVEEDVSMAP